MAPTPATTALITAAAVAASILARRSGARSFHRPSRVAGCNAPNGAPKTNANLQSRRRPTDVEFTVFGCLAGMARDAVVGGEHLLLGQDEAQGRLELALGACSRASKG